MQSGNGLHEVSRAALVAPAAHVRADDKGPSLRIGDFQRPKCT
jgi:hypothetical protein